MKSIEFLNSHRTKYMFNGVINFSIYMASYSIVAKLLETFNAGKMYLLLELFNTTLPQIYSLIIEVGFGCPVCMFNQYAV